MRWHDDGRPWQLAKRVDDWGGDTSILGEPLPPGSDLQIAVASDTKARHFVLWLYSRDGGELRIVKPWSDVQIEGGAGALPTGKIDTVGVPSATYHGNQVKLWGKGWGGDGGANPDYLYRCYTWVTLVP